MSFQKRVFPSSDYATETARSIADAGRDAHNVVLTGGTTAERVYSDLAAAPATWRKWEVFLSDERCVPPHDPSSNFGMVARTLFRNAMPKAIHRMRGEDPPETAAQQYELELRAALGQGVDLVLLSLGADAHICGLFPASSALDEDSRLCTVIERPDGMTGLTLTPPAILAGEAIYVMAAGKAKAASLRRVISRDGSIYDAPARLLHEHGNVTFLLDKAVVSAL